MDNRRFKDNHSMDNHSMNNRCSIGELRHELRPVSPPTFKKHLVTGECDGTNPDYLPRSAVNSGRGPFRTYTLVGHASI